MVFKPVYRSELLKVVAKYRPLGSPQPDLASLGEDLEISVSNQHPTSAGLGFRTTEVLSPLGDL